MVNIKHPFSGKAKLVWGPLHMGVMAAHVEQAARYKRGSEYTVREPFASIRYGLHPRKCIPERWLVTRNSFDEIREFDNIDTAKVYVESLFALEKE